MTAAPAAHPVRRSGVVVGVDGSVPSQDALLAGLREAQLRGTELTVVVAVTDYLAPAMWGAPVLYPEPDPVDIDEAKLTAERMLSDARDAVPGSESVPTTVVAVRGTPAEVLCQRANEAELLVVGSRGQGGFSRFVLGSVSSAVVHHSTSPVLVVRHEQPT